MLVGHAEELGCVGWIHHLLTQGSLAEINLGDKKEKVIGKSTGKLTRSRTLYLSAAKMSSGRKAFSGSLLVYMNSSNFSMVLALMSLTLLPPALLLADAVLADLVGSRVLQDVLLVDGEEDEGLQRDEDVVELRGGDLADEGAAVHLERQ